MMNHRSLVTRLVGLPLTLAGLFTVVSGADEILPSMAQVDPVVVLFVDSSPSMSAISTPADYQPDNAYPPWEFQATEAALSLTIADGPFVDIRNINSEGCAAGSIRGQRQTMSRCLRLPPTDDGG